MKYLSCIIISVLFNHYTTLYFDEDDVAIKDKNIAFIGKKINHKDTRKYTKKIVGYFVPPQTGEYKFYSSCEEKCDVYLSGNEKPSGKSKIITQTKKTEANTFDRYPSQASHLIYLNEGKRYYIEADTKIPHGLQNTHMSVGVILPDDTKLFPIKKPFIKHVVVENLPLNTSQAKQYNENGRQKSVRKSNRNEKKLKDAFTVGLKTSKYRVGKKLKQISRFIKDLQKTKVEEAKFDSNFDDVMANLQHSLEKYAPIHKKTMVKQNRRNMTDTKEKNKLKSKFQSKLHPKPLLTQTGSSRSLQESDHARKQQTVEDLLDALQNSLDSDSKKTKKFYYYHKKFENLMDQINSLKGEVGEDIVQEKPEKRFRGDKDLYHSKVFLHNSENVEESSGSGDDNQYYENNFRHNIGNNRDLDQKNDLEDSSIKRFDNDVFSTIPSKKFGNLRQMKSDFDKSDYTDAPHNSYNEQDKHFSKSHFHDKKQEDTDEKRGNYDGNVKVKEKEWHNYDEIHENEHELEPFVKNSHTHDLHHEKEETKAYILSTNNSNGITVDSQSNFQLDPVKNKESNSPLHGIQADESVYRFPPDNSKIEEHFIANNNTNEPSSFKARPEYFLSSSKFHEATGTVRSQANEEDLQSPIVIHAATTQEVPLQVKIVKNENNEKQEIKTLEDTLFKAFQERIVGEKPEAQAQVNHLDHAQFQNPTVSFTQVKPEEQTINDNNLSIEKKPASVTMVNIDTSNLQSVLNNAFNGKKINEGKNVENNNLREKLQESIETALLHNTQGTDSTHTEISKPSAKLFEQENLLYKTDDNSAANIVNMYTNALKSSQKNGIDDQFSREPIRHHKDITESAEQRTPAFLHHDFINEYAKEKDANYIDHSSQIIGNEETSSLISNKLSASDTSPNELYISDLNAKTKELKDRHENNEKAALNEIPLSEGTDQQVFSKISDLIREINNIKMEIVAMKRNKVTGLSYKKSLVAKLKAKTKLLTKLQAKKDLIMKPILKRHSVIKP